MEEKKVKILFAQMDGLGTKCIMGQDGSLAVVSQYNINSAEEMTFLFDGIRSFAGKFFSASYAKEAEDGFFYRFTSDRDEFRKIQAGEYTQSVNHTDNRLERGISVSKDMSYCALGAYDYFYKVSGKVIGRGSDGEPLLDAATMKKHSNYMSISSYCKKAEKKSKEKKEDFMKNSGWSEQQLLNLQYGHSFEISYISSGGEIKKYSRWDYSKTMTFKSEEDARNFIDNSGFIKIFKQ